MPEPVYGYKPNYGRAEVIPMSELGSLDLSGGVPPITDLGKTEIAGAHSTWSDAAPLAQWDDLPDGVYMLTVDGHITYEDAANYGATPSAVALILSTGLSDPYWGDSYEILDTALTYNITNQSTVVPINRSMLMARTSGTLALRLHPAWDSGYFTVDGEFDASINAHLYRLR
jgi:hypothetical protein